MKGWIEEELDRIGLTENSSDPMNREMRWHALELMEVFYNQGHSGCSANYLLGLITRLMDFKCLSPLTGDDAEWQHIQDDPPLWQNRRYSAVFKGGDGRAYDINARVVRQHYKDQNGESSSQYVSNSKCTKYIEFPYMPPDEPEIIDEE